MYDVHLPANEQLRKCVQFIYCYSNALPEKQFTAVPFIGAALTVFENAKFTEARHRFFCAEPHTHTTVMMHVMRPDSVEVLVKGSVNAFMIMFTPLGINHFIKQPLVEFLSLYQRSVIPFHEYAEGYTDLVHQLQSTECTQQKLQFIEQFLLLNYHPFENELLYQAVNLLSNQENTDSIHKICRQIGAGERTLNRLFQKYLCVSPIQFRNICRFRSSLDLKIKKELSICELALESNYTDHAYLVRVYKKFTGCSPKEIFKRFNSGHENYLFNIIQQKLSEKYNRKSGI